MQEFFTLLGIVGAVAIGAVSPGPTFLMVARTSVATSRANGIAAAFGIGIGGVIYTVAALAGLQALFAAVPSLYLVLKLAGGLYLVYLGYRIWTGAAQPLELAVAVDGTPTQDSKRAFWTGLATQLSNPKAAVFYASIFAAFQFHDFSLLLNLCIISAIFMIECGWYVLVATVLSSTQPRAAYLRYKAWIDRSAGGVMAVLGLRLIASARQA
ncbi:MAG: LysE family translocator [Burkholderiaceae bacterium]|nr:LysE family translocator [Burkholderiaceae bacterium]